MITTIILLGILGAIISAVLGTFWYSMATPMGRLHMRSLGFDKLSEEEKKKMIKEAKPHMWKSYLLQMFLSFLTSAFIAGIMLYQKSMTSAVYGEIFAIWLCFTVPLIGQALIWNNHDRKLALKKFFSDGLFNLVVFLVIAFVFSLII
ncbi:MAG: hypothetical protein RI945_68 [Candidatus Parcubacteria bacterium]